jgi:hypothetical protein
MPYFLRIVFANIPKISEGIWEKDANDVGMKMDLTNKRPIRRSS